MQNNFFPERVTLNPTIYAYELKDVSTHKGLLKVGFTTRDVKTRITEQLKTSGIQYRIILEESAVRNDGSAFSDHDIHKRLKKIGFKNPSGEWFKCTKEDVLSAIISVRDRIDNEENRVHNFKMRPEQSRAVQKTMDYIRSFREEKDNTDKVPRFLWNAKMRFGKTFASYQLAKTMKWTKILVMTFKPAVQSAWEEDLKTHLDFEGWQFITKNELRNHNFEESKPMVVFGSFQDFLGKNTKTGGIKTRNEILHTLNWDCVIFDEYHYGAWRERAKELFEEEDPAEIKFQEGAGTDFFDEDFLPITTNAFLYLSGTPFRAIETGEFIEEQIFNWTYSDEQEAKKNWKDANNPYSSLPRMVLMTYQLPDTIQEIAKKGEFNEFDLNIFFSAEGEGSFAEFKYKSEVQKWLNLIRGSFLETTIDNLKMGAKKPPMPFSDTRLLNLLTHTFWFLPTVASCWAMHNLMHEKQNTFYHDYNIIVAAGIEAGIGVKALDPVLAQMENPLKTKTITLSCGKLTTGVSVKPWSGIFMLRNSSSPETYFQAAFRVQTPWTMKNPDGKNPNKLEILKEECYVFDFAPNRALRQIADYSCRLNINDDNPEQKVAEFINFLPVLCYDGSSMKAMDPAGVLDIAMSGTSATLLARRWESALLVNVDNSTLSRLMKNENALEALMRIEGFRTINKDIETIINKSEKVKKARKDANDEEISSAQKKELSKEEKEYKSMRKKIQEKLIKFATRIPVFLYLTDYRERTLRDVIQQLEPVLFRKVTGLEVKEFDLLVSLGVFNSSLMNDAVYKFKRYEDKSLSYAGINKHEGENVGLYDTVLKENEIFEEVL